jgi:hypothetical protein
MNPIYLRGLGLWSTGFANPESWCRGDADPEIVRAEAAILEGPLRRRASPLTRVSVEVFDQVVRSSGVDPKEVPTIWGTSHGEHGTAIKLLKMMLRGEGKVSPTHFHNSVHNTPSAYASISGGNASASTTLTGGGELVSAAILEAFCLLNAGVDEVIVVLGDEPLQEPFDRNDMQQPLAIGFCFSRKPDRSNWKISRLRRERLPSAKPHDRLGGLYVSAGLPLLEHVITETPGTIALEAPGRATASETQPVWCVELDRIFDSVLDSALDPALDQALDPVAAS